MTDLEITNAIRNLTEIKVKVTNAFKTGELMDFEDFLDSAIKELGEFYINKIKKEAEASVLKDRPENESEF